MLDRYKYNEKFYYYNEENCRYLIGTVGTKPLIYFGLNPSSATPSKTDNTFRRLQDIAKFNDFDSIIIVNLYPFLNTETYKKSSIVNKQEKINFQVISDIIQKLSISMKLKVLFCWGDNIKNYENYNYNRRKVVKY